MTQPFTRDTLWFLRAFRPRDTQRFPSGYDETVIPTVDTFGTDKYRFAETSVTTSAASVNVAVGPTVPDTEIWFILAASFVNGEVAATTRNMRIFYETARALLDPFQTAIASANLQQGGVEMIVTRPFYLPPGARLRGLQDGITLGVSVTLAFTFIRLSLGEYVQR